MAFFGSSKAEVSSTIDKDISKGVRKAIFVVFDVDDDNLFWLSTCSKILFGCLINLGRREIVALFVLFLTGGALSALLSEGMVLRALLELPSKLLSLLFSELIFVLVLGLLLRSDTRQWIDEDPRLLLLVGTLL